MFDTRLIALAKGSAAAVALSVAFRLLGLAADALAIWTVASVLGSAIAQAATAGGSGSSLLAQAACICAACAFVRFCAAALARRFATRAADACRTSVRRSVYAKLIALGPAYRETMSDAEAYSLMGNGVEQLAAYTGSYLPQLLFGLSGPLVLFAVLASLNVYAGASMLVCVVAIPVSIMAFMRQARSALGAYWDAYVDLGARYREAIGGLVTLKAYRADGAWHAGLKRQSEGFRNSTMRLLRVQLGAVALMESLSAGGMAVGAVIAAAACVSGSMDAGAALAVVLISLDFFEPMRRLGELFHTGMNARQVSARLFELLDSDEPAAVEHGPLETQRPEVVCRGLGYAYRDGRRALEQVDFAAAPGSFIGITGESGSGKSTLARILSGRLCAYEGSVEIGGVEASELAPGELQSLVTLVSSDSRLFKGTLRSNLAFACPEATDADMWNALHRCRLDSFAVAAGGLDAPVSEGGANLSGGQRQRLCCARALLHATPIYVFDEATANIDAESEQALLEFVQELSLERTVIVVSHRLKMLAWADAIYVLDEGRVAQTGVHARLHVEEGVYRDLWDQQRELEYVADQAQLATEAERAADGASDEKLQRLIANMPDKIASVVRGAYDAQAISQLITGEKRSLPLGHPSWIPLDEGNASAPSPAASPVQETAGDEAVGSAAEPSEKQNACGKDLSESPSQKPPRSWGNVARGLGKALHGQAGALLCCIALGLGSAAGSLAIPALATAGAVGAIAGGGTASGLAVFAGALAVCAVVHAACAYGERLCTHDLTFSTLAALRDRIFTALRKLAPARLEQRDHGDLLSLVTSDVDLLERFYSRTITPIVVAVVVALAMTAIVGIASRCAAAVAVAIAGYVAVGLVIPALSGQAVRADSARMRNRAVRMGTFLLESLAGLSEVVQYGWADTRMDELETSSKAPTGPEAVTAHVRALAQGASAGLSCLFKCAFALVLAAFCSLGAVDAATAAVLAVAYAASFSPIQTVSSLGVSLGQAMAAGTRVLDVLEERPVCPDVTDAPALAEFSGATMCDVTFGYGGKTVLDGVNVSIPRGSIVRITGPSGTGKSTLVKLLMRFWDPDSGTVEISERNLAEVRTDSLRALEGYLVQDTVVFAGTLRDNIVLVRPNATDEQLRAAIEKASLAPLVERLPEGLETLIGVDGAQLSDGERQRLGLARMFLYDAPFLLLDEPTSSLDSLNEAAVLMSLASNRAGKTMVIVSHRPSIGLIADRTYATRRAAPVLTMGKII